MTIINKNLHKLCSTDHNFFLNRANVNGVGYGLKEINGVQTDIHCFKVLVQSKLSLDELDSSDLIPKEYKGYPTDVIEVGEITSHAFTSTVRPAEGGVSIGITNQFIVGTLCCETLGFIGSKNETYLLSNNHVIDLENSVLKYTNILQPGYGDGGSPTTGVIARLYRSIPIQFTIGANQPVNYVDCSLGIVDNPSLITNSVYNIGTIEDIAPPKLNLPIQKFGRTTSYTTGTITALNASVTVSYANGKALFQNQILATPMSSAGDSGSPVLDMNNRIIGILFAGSSSITAINYISNVLSFLGIRIP